MAEPLFARVALLGLGLIGSSLARALRRHGLASHIAGHARSRRTASDDRQLPVGLFGLARNSNRVRAVTRSISASTSAVRSRSGAATGVAPTDRAAIGYMRKP